MDLNEFVMTLLYEKLFLFHGKPRHTLEATSFVLIALFSKSF